MIDKNLTLDRTRTSCLKPEIIAGINTGDLLTPEIINDIATGDLLSASAKVDILTGNALTPEQINLIVTGDLLTSLIKQDISTGGLLLAELKVDVETGNLLSAQTKVDILTGNLIAAEAKADITTGSLLSSKSKSDIVTGDLLSSKAKVDIGTGSVLTPIALPDNDNLPLNYARICYDNTLRNGAASATSDDLKSANMLTPSTYDKWRPTANPSDCTLIGTSQLCDYVAIAAHNLSGSTVVINVSNGGGLTGVYNAVVPSNTPLLVRFTESTYDRVFIEITGTTTAEVGVVYLGKELAMMRPNYSGYSPATLSSKDVFTPQTSDGGQFLGKQLVRKGFSTQASFANLTYDWYESEFQPFVLHAKQYPYFWAWNLLEHPDEIVYGWTNQNITPSLMGVRNWLEVSFDIDAHGNL